MQIAVSCFGLKHKYKQEFVFYSVLYYMSISCTCKFPVNVNSGLCSI